MNNCVALPIMENCVANTHTYVLCDIFNIIYESSPVFKANLYIYWIIIIAITFYVVDIYLGTRVN